MIRHRWLHVATAVLAVLLGGSALWFCQAPAASGSGRSGVFLRVDGVKGACTDARHREWIDVSRFVCGVAQPGGASGQSTRARRAGRADFRPLVITKRLDIASPRLFLYCAEGRRIPSVTLEVCQRGRKFFSVQLRDAIVLSVKAERAKEEVSFGYGTIQWECMDMGPGRGRPGASVRSGWSVRDNRPM